MTDINTQKIDFENGIILGRDDAPVKLVEFTNLRCPYCRQWWQERHDLIAEYVAAGRVQHIIKLFDKEKPSLAAGDVMHHHVPQDESAPDVISSIFETQDDWGNLDTLEDVADYAVNTLGLTLQNHKEMSTKIKNETLESGVFFIPTMIVNDQVFDQKIALEDLKALLD